MTGAGQCKHEQVVAGEIYYCQLGDGHARMHYHESDHPAFKIGYRAGQLAMRERAAELSESGRAYKAAAGCWGECSDGIAKGIRALKPEESA